jgi:hypothetical protein
MMGPGDKRFFEGGHRFVPRWAPSGPLRCLGNRGATIRKTMDLSVATSFIEHGHALLHAERDFGLIDRHLPLVLTGRRLVPRLAPLTARCRRGVAPGGGPALDRPHFLA